MFRDKPRNVVFGMGLALAGMLVFADHSGAQAGDPQQTQGVRDELRGQYTDGPPQQVGPGRNFTPRITGSVTGTVFFADTQRPARFANVQLIPVSSVSGGSFRGGGGGSNARTALDGTFLVENVEVGDYYLAAWATGYISPVTQVQALLAAGANQDDVLRQLTLVHVAQGAPSSTSLTLVRGAVLAGTAVWDDGTPAAGVSISAVPATSTSQPGNFRGGLGGPVAVRGPGGGDTGTTDDRGRFRLMGLAPGEYNVRATVQAPLGATAAGRGGFSRTASLSVYAPDKLRRAEADVIKIGSAEEHEGVTLTLNLRALHTVSGRVSSGGGGAVTGGQVRLVDSSDSSLSRSGEIASDGSFSVPYVPAGTYNMTLNARTGGSGNPGQGGGFNPGQSFQPLQQTLAVTDGDVSGLAFTATPAVTAASR